MDKYEKNVKIHIKTDIKIPKNVRAIIFSF